MDKPLLFISHKHSDEKIASVLSKFLNSRTLSQIDIFQSSNPKFAGPQLGGNLSDELNKALWKCDTLVLIYTSADNNWSYCMYECGVATVPNSQATKIIVFQCGKDVPDLYKDSLRVNARSRDSIKIFIKEFLKNPEFFPSLQRAFSPDVDEDLIETASKELYDNLIAVLPNEPDDVEEWPAWPYFKIEIPKSEVQKISNAPVSERITVAQDIIKNNAVIIKSDARISQIFGLASLPERCPFIKLLTQWQTKYPDEQALWFESCCEQIMAGALREFPIIKNASIIEVNTAIEYTPVLSRVKSMTFGSGVSQFDIYFYNLKDPRAVPVSANMIKLVDMFTKRIGAIKPSDMPLKALKDELDNKGLNRIPVLSDDNIPVYVIHKSMIDEFMLKKLLGTPSVPVDQLTLQLVLDDPSYASIFKDSFALVPHNASMAEAKDAMLSKKNCSDVFITKNGNENEPVIGWLTNKDITKAS